MKAFVVPIYGQINALTDEKITLGICLVVDGQEVELAASLSAVPVPYVNFKLSKKKIRVVCKLTGASESFFAAAEKQIQNAVASANHADAPVFTASLFAYLNKYTSGLIKFGEMLPLAGLTPAAVADHSAFQKLFAEFTGDHEAFTVPEKYKSFKKAVRAHFNKDYVRGRADVGVTFTPEMLPGLIKRTSSALIAVNGEVKSVHTLDFNAAKGTIQDQLNGLEVYHKALGAFVQGQSALHRLTLVVNPPFEEAQSELYERVQAQKEDLFEFVGPDAAEEIAHQLVANQYRKFSEAFGITLS